MTKARGEIRPVPRETRRFLTDGPSQCPPADLLANLPVRSRKFAHALHRHDRAGFMGTVDAAGDNTLESRSHSRRRTSSTVIRPPGKTSARRSLPELSEPTTGATDSSG